MADSIRIQVDVAFPCGEHGELSRDAQEIHDVLLDVLARARKLAADVTEREPTTHARRHICRHASGLPCDACEELTDESASVITARSSVAPKP